MPQARTGGMGLVYISDLIFISPIEISENFQISRIWKRKEQPSLIALYSNTFVLYIIYYITFNIYVLPFVKLRKTAQGGDGAFLLSAPLICVHHRMSFITHSEFVPLCPALFLAKVQRPAAMQMNFQKNYSSSLPRFVPNRVFRKILPQIPWRGPLVGLFKIPQRKGLKRNEVDDD